MKKLLGILGTITIAGSGISGIVGNAPAIARNAINYQQTNNLKKLNRVKRNSNFPPKDFKGINISNNVDNYFIQLCEFITYLRENKIIKTIRGQVSSDNNPVSCGLDGHTPREDYFINPNTLFNYFKIPIIIEANPQPRVIDLIFRSNDFYLQGFINNQNYYYFNDAEIMSIVGALSNNNLGFEGDYNHLRRVASSNSSNSSENPQITWEGIQSSFFELSNMGTPHQQNNPIIATSLIRVILATSESLRFRQVQNLIINSVNHQGMPGISVYWNNFIEIIKNWLKWTKEAIAHLLINNNLFNFPRIQDILIFNSLINDNFKSCNRRQARDLNSNDEYCFNIPEKIVYFRDDHNVSEHYGEYSSEKEFYDFSEVEIGDIVPLNYNKIEFFGEQLTKVSWGNDAYYGEKINDSKLGKNFKEHIFNINIRDFSKEKYKEVAKITLSDKCANDGWAWMCDTQKAGITFYWKQSTKKWHIQVITYRWIRTGVTYSGGANWISIGNGIKLS